MQKFIFIEAHSGESFGLDINSLLEQGWKVVEIHANNPSRGGNIHALVLIEKEDKSIAQNTACKQKIICLNQESYHDRYHDNLKKLFNKGWVIKQMQTGGGSDGACCFVWLEM